MNELLIDAPCTAKTKTAKTKTSVILNSSAGTANGGRNKRIAHKEDANSADFIRLASGIVQTERGKNM